MLKDIDRTNLITGAALTVAATALVPVVTGTLRPLAVLGVKGIIGLLDGTKTTIQYAREEFEDIVAEAQFERMKRQGD